MTDPGRTSFWEELRRRHVVRAVSVYAVAAWVVVQVADVFFPALLLPNWSVGGPPLLFPDVLGPSGRTPASSPC